MNAVVSIADIGAVLILLLAAISDIMVRSVSNIVVAALILCACIAAAAEHRLMVSTGVAVALLGVTFLLWIRGYMGGADAKLLAACGLLLSPACLGSMLLLTAIAGGLLCVPYLPGRRLFSRPSQVRPASLLRRVMRCEQWRLRRRGPLPYAVAIAAAGIFTILHGS